MLIIISIIEMLVYMFLFPLINEFYYDGDLFIFLLIRFVVIDEAHAYKGAFGCHTALIIRRLRRLCSHGKFFPVYFTKV